MTEQQPYTLERTLGDIEVRRYPRHVVAQTTVTASFEDAGSAAFRRLVSYIGGQNTAKANIAMTAPVTQQGGSRKQGDSQKIAMTAPVTQSGGDGQYVVAFVLPADLTIDTAPQPTNPDVELREVPERLAVAVTFSGRGSEQAFSEQAAHAARHHPASGARDRSASCGTHASTRRTSPGSSGATRSSRTFEIG